MLGPLCNQTVNLETDAKTLYYSLRKLKYSPSIYFKGKKTMDARNSHINSPIPKMYSQRPLQCRQYLKKCLPFRGLSKITKGQRVCVVEVSCDLYFAEVLFGES